MFYLSHMVDVMIWLDTYMLVFRWYVIYNIFVSDYFHSRFSTSMVLLNTENPAMKFNSLLLNFGMCY